jgi:predicted RecA/RadA family phage recombinase
MPNALRTATPMGDWRTFKFTCDVSAGLLGIRSARAAGDPWLYLVEDTVGALLEDADYGEEGVLVYHAEKIMVAKMTESTDIFLPGDRVYWDPSTRYVTPAYDSAYYWIGIATEPAAASAEEVEIDLKGDHAEVELVLP